MSDEHPFAVYIRTLGKGPKLSRSLTEAEACAATRMLLAGEVDPVQVGAFLCLLRVKTETPAEVAGIVRAARETLPSPRESADLDWPAYAGKSRRLPWFLLSARLLAQHGIRVVLHGDTGHAPDVLGFEPLLALVGIPRAGSIAEAGRLLQRQGVAFLPLAAFQPRLEALLALRALLGVRSPLNTALRQLNPLGARCQMIGVAHPGYREVQRDAAALLGQPNIAVFKGEGGEAERRPEKPCEVRLLVDGVARDESFAPLLANVDAGEPLPLDPRRIAAVWRGEVVDASAESCVIGTAAIALRLLRRAESPLEADALAARWWRERRLEAVACA